MWQAKYSIVPNFDFGIAVAFQPMVLTNWSVITIRALTGIWPHTLTAVKTRDFTGGLSTLFAFITSRASTKHLSL